MRLLFIFLCFGIFFICACKEEVLLHEGINYYGETITPEGSIGLEEILRTGLAEGEKQVKLSGEIVSVCQKKGCWMYLSGPESKERVLVQFKDYAFFVPKNCNGLSTVVQGVLKKTTKSVEELKHYAEDEGQSPEEIEAITEPREELSLMAEGVIIYN